MIMGFGLHLGIANLVRWRCLKAGLQVQRIFPAHVITPVRGYNSDIRQGEMDGNKNVKADATLILGAAIESVLPHTMITSNLRLRGDIMCIGEREYPLRRGVYIVAFGKAVLGMVRAAEDVLGDKIIGGLASVPVGLPATLRGMEKWDLLPSATCAVEICEGAANNLPDGDAFNTSQRIKQMLKTLRSEDTVLTLISGGGSALLPFPRPPMTLEDLATTTALLSRHGASIQQLNTVRKHLEELKGGGLAHLAYPAQMATMILSDVVGDDLDFIASGPTVPSVLPPRHSVSLIEKLGVQDQLPLHVMKWLRSSHSDSQGSFPNSHVYNLLVGSNTRALNAARRRAKQAGYLPIILSHEMTGDVKEAANIFSKLLWFIVALMYGRKAADGTEISRVNTKKELELISLGVSKPLINELRTAIKISRNNSQPVCVLTGGETTVNVTGRGLGGRNQELAMLLGKELQELGNEVPMDVSPVFLSAGTDGQDGSTAAAGAVVDTQTLTTATQQGIHADEYLADNDSYNFFKSVDHGSCHVVTGLTGTNVMDIQILLLTPNSINLL